jgi:hypothetical protein
MTRDQALAKIKKCLALAKSTNPHEAAAAMRQAQKLMAEYSVSDHDMSLIDVNEVRAKAVSSAANSWEVRLVKLVCDAFGCEYFSSVSGCYNDSGNYVRKHEWTFIGTDAAPTIAAYAYEVLSRQCAKARLEHIRRQPKNCKPITKTTRGDEFAQGWVYGAGKLVERFATGDRDKPMLISYLQAKYPGLRMASVRDTGAARKTDFGHTLAGMTAAQAAQLNRGVGGLAEQELLS